jgi:ABC1 atypical kinase-like domain
MLNSGIGIGRSRFHRYCLDATVPIVITTTSTAAAATTYAFGGVATTATASSTEHIVDKKVAVNAKSHNNNNIHLYRYSLYYLPQQQNSSSSTLSENIVPNFQSTFTTTSTSFISPIHQMINSMRLNITTTTTYPSLIWTMITACQSSPISCCSWIQQWPSSTTTTTTTWSSDKNKLLTFRPSSYHTVNDHDDDNGYETSSTFILACSSTSTATTTAAAEPFSIFKRLLRWMQKWCQRTWNFLLVTLRVSEVVVLLSPLLILAPVAILTSPMNDSIATATADLAWFYAVRAIQGIGPVAIKFCQWVATRRDIFPPELCNRLSILHDRGYPHSWRYTHKTLQEAFGTDYASQGLIVSPDDVIGCGSAAQVYKGKIRIENQQQQKEGKETEEEKSRSSSYRDVAIKVLHPNFQEMVDRDLELICILADFAHSLPIESIRMLNLPRAVGEFSVVLHDQSDLNIEADNLRRFRKNFYAGGTQQQQDTWGVVFPQPINRWTSSKVLVEDYVYNAAPIADFLLDSSEEGMEIRRELAGTCIWCVASVLVLFIL